MIRALFKTLFPCLCDICQSVQPRAKLTPRESEGERKRAVSVTLHNNPHPAHSFSHTHTHTNSMHTLCCCCCMQSGHGIKTHSDVWRPRRCRIPQRVGYSEESPCPDVRRGHCSPSENRPSVHETAMDTTAIKTKTATTKGQTDNKPFQIFFHCLRALVLV